MSSNSRDAQYINALILHEHEVGRANSPPKLLKLDNFWLWKQRFESYIRFTDIGMWIMMNEGYDWPTLTNADGVVEKYKYGDMNENQKREYALEGKALSTIQMCLPRDSMHLFQSSSTSKELLTALAKHCEGDELMKKNRIKLLKRQYEVFNGLQSETLDALMIRYTHLTTELAHFGINYSQNDLVDKFLDSLPKQWQEFVHDLQDHNDFDQMTLTEIFSKLRNRDMKRRAKDNQSDFTQNPNIYHASGDPFPSTSVGTSAFLTKESVQPVMDSDSSNAYLGYDHSSGNMNR